MNVRKPVALLTALVLFLLIRSFAWAEDPSTETAEPTVVMENYSPPPVVIQSVETCNIQPSSAPVAELSALAAEPSALAAESLTPAAEPLIPATDLPTDTAPVATETAPTSEPPSEENAELPSKVTVEYSPEENGTSCTEQLTEAAPDESDAAESELTEEIIDNAVKQGGDTSEPVEHVETREDTTESAECAETREETAETAECAETREETAEPAECAETREDTAEPTECAETLEDPSETEEHAETSAGTVEPSEKSASTEKAGGISGQFNENHQVDTGGINVRSIRVAEDSYNASYSYISFSFCSDADSTLYLGYVTGLKITSVWNEESYKKLITDIAACFYAGTPFSVSDSTAFEAQYDLCIQPIDAEKQVFLPGSTSDTPDAGDSNQCWAASDADMLQYSGWLRQTPLTEDSILSYYSEHFTDEASSQEAGTKWIFNGVNPKQNVEGSGTSYNAAQVKNTGTDPALLAAYAEENYVSHADIERCGIDAFAVDVLNMRDLGTAIGIGVDYYNEDGTWYGSHALTVFGFIKDTVSKGIDALKAVFISDSDNSAQKTNTGTVVEKSCLENSVTMYTLSGRDIGTETTLKSVELDNYASSNQGEQVHAVIADYTTLSPCTSAAVKETGGTRNPVITIDFAVESAGVCDLSGCTVTTAAAGEKLFLSATVKNVSYEKLDGSRNPTLSGYFRVYRNGQLISTINGSVQPAETQLLQMTDLVIHTPCTFAVSGIYSIDYVINGVFYSDGSGVVEAYTLNNCVRQRGSLLIPGKEPPPHPSGDTHGMRTGIAVKKKACPVFSVQFDLSGDLSGREFSIPFTLETKTAIKGLYNGDVLIPLTCYSIYIMVDGTYLLYFNPAYLVKLRQGTYTYTLLGEDHRPMAVFSVEIIR